MGSWNHGYRYPQKPLYACESCGFNTNKIGGICASCIAIAKEQKKRDALAGKLRGAQSIQSSKEC